jgi:hypothetical protein
VGDAKRIEVKPISVSDARRVVKQYHYSGKVDPRSSLNLGVFYNGRCEGAIQLGIPIDKRKAIGIVSDTPWNGFLDLHRLAFSQNLPRNSESRAIGYMMRWIRKTYPFIQWVQSCGDGAIYRASGFVLVGIKENSSMYRMPDGSVKCKLVFEPGFGGSVSAGVKGQYGKTGSETSSVFLKRIGASKLLGFQLRYVYFLDPTARERLTVPVLPFSEIQRRGAKMYRGQRAGSAASGTAGVQPAGGGATPTPALSQSTGVTIE